MVSGEILRLLNILSVRPNGATKRELIDFNGFSAKQIYDAVVLDLVYAHRLSDDEAYCFCLREAGRALLTSNGRNSPRGE